jgi:uncharacterized protein
VRYNALSVNARLKEKRMSLAQLLHDKRDEVIRIAAQHGVTRVRVFGSVARDQATATSDIDLLVDIGPQTSPWFPAGLVLDLEGLLGQPVDIVTERAIRPELRESVLRDAFISSTFLSASGVLRIMLRKGERRSSPHIRFKTLRFAICKR